MEWFSSFINLIKLPRKLIYIVLCFSLMMIILPNNALKYLSVDEIVEKYRSIISVVLILTTAYGAIDIVTLIYRIVISVSINRQNKKSAYRKLEEIDPSEKAVLREFYIQNRNTIRLPFDNPIVSGLINSNILEATGTIGEGSIAGILLPFKISGYIRNKIIPQIHLDIPFGRELTKDDIEWLKDNRPDFMEE